MLTLQTGCAREEKKLNKYELKPPLDLSSEFRRRTQRERNDKLEQEHESKRQDELRKLKEWEKVEVDAEHGRRSHAWIVIISDEDGITKKFRRQRNVKALFIEPSTGLLFTECDDRYLSVESVWNNEHYYVS